MALGQTSQDLYKELAERGMRSISLYSTKEMFLRLMRGKYFSALYDEWETELNEWNTTWEGKLRIAEKHNQEFLLAFDKYFLKLEGARQRRCRAEIRMGVGGSRRNSTKPSSV